MCQKNESKIRLQSNAQLEHHHYASRDADHGTKDVPASPTGAQATSSCPIECDLSAQLETPIGIIEDLISSAIEEIGNGGNRALSLLMPIQRYIADLKDINKQLFYAESASMER